MSVPYHADLADFSLEDFRRTLETEELLPSRQILREEIEDRFAVLERTGIRNLQQLTAALGSKKKIERLALETGVPAAYLTVLRRQTLLYTPKPIPLAKLPGVEASHLQQLAAIGITQTRQMFEQEQDVEERRQLADRSGIPMETLTELVKLSDLARVGWVGPVYVRLIYAAGAEDLEQLAHQDPAALFDRMVAVNDEHAYTKAGFSLKDIARTIELAKRLPKANLDD